MEMVEKNLYKTKRKYGYILILFCALIIFSIGCATTVSVDDTIYIVSDGTLSNKDVKGLQKSLKEAGAKKVKRVAEGKEPDGAYRILLGNLDAEETKLATVALQEGESILRFYENAVVIVGDKVENMRTLLEKFQKTYIPIYKSEGAFPGSEHPGTGIYSSHLMQSLCIEGADVANYVVVTKDGKPSEASKKLTDVLEHVLKIKMDVVATDELKEEQYAIIFGTSDARESANIVAECNAGEYIIRSARKTLYLCAGENEDEITASRMFLLKYLGYDYVSDTVKNTAVAVKTENFKFTTNFEPEGEYDSIESRIATYSPVEEFNILQGGCSDGKYYYFAFQDQGTGSGNCIILKVNQNDWNVVAQSEPLSLGHANSMTYYPKTNQLLINNMEPNGKTISYVDADSLVLTGTREFGRSFWSVSYVPERNMLVFGCSGNCMVFTDPDTLEEKQVYRFLGEGRNRQNYNADADNIYILSWNPGSILICDWDGTAVADIALGVYLETEHLITAGNSFYVGYLNEGATIYETILYKDISESTK